MSLIEIYLWGLVVGIFIGWQTHALILDLAYRFGIVEHKGVPKEPKP